MTIEHCPTCKRPAHPTESDEFGRCAECAPPSWYLTIEDGYGDRGADAEDAELLAVMHRVACARLRDAHHQGYCADEMMRLAREVNRAEAALELARGPAKDARWN